jgi:uncharacterized protein (TIGR03435 family)
MKRLAIVCGLAVTAVAQDQAPLAFEVVSIKRSAPDTRGGNSISPGGRISITGTTLKFLMLSAYNVEGYRISGLNGWMESERYDVMGKAPEGTMRGPTGRAAEWKGADGAGSSWTAMDPNSENARQFRAMLQTMLADRFQLKLHHESKELSVYALVVAKSGPKLDESKSDSLQMKWGMGQITYKGAALTFLTSTLSRLTGRPVVDQTGLTKNYDYTLQWTPDEGQMQMFRAAGDWSSGASAESGPSVFTALQEQLGLKLESTKAPVDILVVDHAEKPSEN